MTYRLVGLKTEQNQYNETRRDNETLSGLCVVHTAENNTSFAEPDNGAENVLNYIATREDFGSYHRIADSDSVVKTVPWDMECFHCKYTNRFSVGISAAVKSEDWKKLFQVDHLDFPSRGHSVIDKLAIEASDFVKHMKNTKNIDVPLKIISREQALNKEPGFIAHAGTDPERRTDPGDDFDWTYFFERVAHHLGVKETVKEEDKTVAMTMASPAVGRVSSEYGWRPKISNKIPAMLHAGIDIANKVGTPIYSAFAGKVEKAGWNVVPGRSGQGVLILNPDGERQYYGHLNAILVKAGQNVKIGQRIGDMGATGNVTGSHLHFECWDRYKTPINPRRAFESHQVKPGVLNFKVTENNVVSKPQVKPEVHVPVTVVPFYTRQIDGDPGKYTWIALQEFLKSKGYYKNAVDGVAGSKTWTALQEFLKDRKLYTRTIDGKLGEYTIRGLQEFLKKNKWYNRAVDGKAGYWTWRGLQEYLARRAK